MGHENLRPILLALTAVAALSIAHPAKANLITNPGFETLPAFTGWDRTGYGIIDNFSPHSGTWSAFIGTASGPATLAQSVATTPGSAYTIGFFAEVGAGTQNFTLTVTFGTTTIFSHLFTTFTGGWVGYTFNATAPTSSTLLKFSVSGASGGVGLDDISVEPTGVGVPDGGTTASLLGCALVGLAGLRRKLGC